MAHRPIGARPRVRNSLRTVLGLPASALAAMVGIVLVINPRAFGWAGVAGGAVLTAGAIVLGVHCFRAAPSAANQFAASSCPESGENHE